MTDEKRTVCGFEVHLAMHVGEREVLFLLDPTSTETPYIVGYCEGIPAFVAERFVDAVGSDDYLEAVDEFLLRAKGQVDQLRAERESTGEPQEAIGEAHCLPSGMKHHLEGRVVILKPEALRHEYRNAASQLIYVTGGNGRDGRKFHTTWYDVQPDLKTDVFRDEFKAIMDYLRDASLDPIEGPDVFKFHCLQNMRYRVTDTTVRFKIVTQHYSYYFRCQPGPGNYNLYAMAYDNRFLLPLLERPNKAASLYKTGADYWKTVVEMRGADTAPAICGGFLKEQLGEELSREEKQFCRELFAAMFDATAGRTDPAKLVYPYPPQEATERGERTLYFEHRDRNGECASAIGAAISGSCYRVNFYNLDIAAMTMIQQYGFPRVNAVLARVIQRSEWDGRYSYANKQWAREYPLPEKAFENVYMNDHPVLIDGLADHVRELYDAVGAERFALPGQPESGETVEGYKITRSIAFNDQRGFAIAAHPNAGHVCWMFRTDRGGRDYYWGHYCESEQDAAANYVARVMEHMSGGAREPAEDETPMEFRYGVGDQVYLGAQGYEIAAVGETTVSLYNPRFPLLNDELSRDEFERRLWQDARNDHLKVPVEEEPEQVLAPETPRELYQQYLPLLLDNLRASDIYLYLRDSDSYAEVAYEQIHTWLYTASLDAEAYPGLDDALRLPEFRNWLTEDLFQNTFQDVVVDSQNQLEQHEFHRNAPEWARWPLPEQNPEIDTPERTEHDTFNEYSILFIQRVLRDEPYLNAYTNADAENARIECDVAVDRAALHLGTEDMELYKLFHDTPGFRERMCDYVFDRTYTQTKREIQRGLKPPAKRATVEQRNFRFLSELAPEILSGEATYPLDGSLISEGDTTGGPAASQSIQTNNG